MYQLVKRFFGIIIGLLVLFCNENVSAQNQLIGNTTCRKSISLNGKWQYIVDPYETGFYDYRYKERNEKDKEAYWNTAIQSSKLDRKEHGYSDANTLMVPGDWNSQDRQFLYYEGTVWYQKSFDYQKSDVKNRVFLYFGAVNYKADVYLNGKKLGSHEGGFTPFNFEITDSVLKANNNFLVVKVDNKRHADDVPTLNTDWWNYGGITREVKLLEVPENFIENYALNLKQPLPGKAPNSKKPIVEGWVKFNSAATTQITVNIPELKFKKVVPLVDGKFQFTLPEIKLWSPEQPKLYKVNISAGENTLSDKIGFRTIEAFGKQLLLNGKPLFMRGICSHAEIPNEIRRAYSEKDAQQLLGWAKELSCNMVRLAHYPHDENMPRLADSLGILIWSEIPVYWTIDFKSKAIWDKANQQLTEMIARDHNRASIIIWSVGNETPISTERTTFMKNLIESAKKQDATRLVSAALEVNYGSVKSMNVIDDPLGEYVDLVSFNEYLGWYGGTPNNCKTANWSTPYNKPLFISETGAGAKAGFHADSLSIFSEEYQEWFYKEQIDMLARMPDNFVGLAPWVLADFRSPKRNNPEFQQGWNRKGLISAEGEKKKAFYVLKGYYDKMSVK